jgi:hypothetical protein
MDYLAPLPPDPDVPWKSVLSLLHQTSWGLIHQVTKALLRAQLITIHQLYSSR